MRQLLDRRAGSKTALPIDGVRCLLLPSLRAGEVSAWHGHVSFAHWLIHAAQPRLLVELGTHNGVSYAAFCNAVDKLGTSTRCYAVDSWEGDPQAGYYGASVYDNLRMFNERFEHFSTLRKCYFDAARDEFADGSIDILHIDGLHTYDAVRNDFETWRPKLSDRAVVLFHDTEVRSGDFGVWQLWADVSRRFPSFNFPHAYGLGVLAVGDRAPAAVLALCDTDAADRVEMGELFALASDSAKAAGLEHVRAEALAKLDDLVPNGRNLALHQPTFQSSVHPTDGGAAGNAVNGIRNGKFGFHTDLEPAPWWMVDLGRPQRIDEIVVFNRLDAGCRDRSQSLEILLSNDGAAWRVLYQHDGPPFGGADGFPLRVPCQHETARFVRIKLRAENYLHLDEVEIYQY